MAGKRPDLAQNYERIEFSKEQIEKARRALAGHDDIADADDAHEMMQALGLMPDQNHWYEKPRSGHGGSQG